MLTAETHPAGATAIFAGETVTIRQWLANGQALIFGTTFNRRAEPEELSDPDGDLPPFDRWARDRIARVGGSVLITTEAAHRDYLSYMAGSAPRSGHQAGEHRERDHTLRTRAAPLTRRQFWFALDRAGFERTRARVPVTGLNGAPSTDPGAKRQWRSCWRMMLHPITHRFGQMPALSSAAGQPQHFAGHA